MSSQPAQQPFRRITKVRQACDGCHARKIRCDGTNPCANCRSTELQCTYLAVPKKKGPKGRRVSKDARALRLSMPITQPFPLPRSSEPRNSNATDTSTSPTSPENVSPNRWKDANPEARSIRGVPGFQASPLVSTEMVTRCLDAFFTHKYPITPILDRQETFASLPHLGSVPEQYGLITACCSVIVLSPEILAPTTMDGGTAVSGGDNAMPTSEFLISETIRARQFCNHSENPSLATVQTSFFLFAALFCLGKDNSAWFYIREAMTMLQLLRLHEESSYSDIPLSISNYCRRTFWLLFITERAYALQRHRPLTLQRTISLPTVDSGAETRIISGFLDLVSLFQNFDDDFIALWNLSSSPSSASPQSLVKLQDVLKCAIPNVSERTEIQQADLLISRQWLKTMVWQLCVSKGLLSSSSSDESMNFHYPVTIARDVVRISSLLPPKAFEAHGVGILEKLFDIGCSLADVLLLRPQFMQPSALDVGPRDYLMEIVRVMGRLLGGNSRYSRLLASKADECLQVRIRQSLVSNETSHDIYEIEDEYDGAHIDDADFSSLGPDTMKHEHPSLRDICLGNVTSMAPRFDVDGMNEPVHYSPVGAQDPDVRTRGQQPFLDNASMSEWDSDPDSDFMAFS